MNILTGLALSASILCGDVNLNGRVTAVDALAALKMAATGGYSVEADVIVDGKIAPVDGYTIWFGEGLICPDVVDIVSNEPVKAMTAVVDFGSGKGFLGEGSDVACTFHEGFLLSVARENTGMGGREGFFGMENFLGLAAIVAPGSNPKPVSGVLATCLAYPGQTFNRVESKEGPVTIRVR